MLFFSKPLKNKFLSEGLIMKYLRVGKQNKQTLKE